MSPGMGLGMNNFMYPGMNINGVPIGGMGNIVPGSIESQILAAQLGGAFSPSLGNFPNGAQMNLSAMGNFGMGMGGLGVGMGMGVQGQPGGPAMTNMQGRGSPAGIRGGAAQRGAFGKTVRPAAKPKMQLKDEDINESLLNDIPAWFHVLRLHKYTPVVTGKPWREIVVMNGAQLEKLGISALGARRKLLKHFVVVRDKFGIPHPEGFEAEASEADHAEGEGGDGDHAAEEGVAGA